MVVAIDLILFRIRGRFPEEGVYCSATCCKGGSASKTMMLRFDSSSHDPANALHCVSMLVEDFALMRNGDI